MKKILTSIMACACLMGFTACDSFLDEEPKGVLTSNNYYLSEAHALQNVNYLYRTGVPARISSTGAYQGSIAQIQGALTGYFTNTYEGQELTYKYGREMIRQQNTMTVGNTLMGEWTQSYKAINVANAAIKYIPGINNIDQANAAQYVAEAKFFRAWNYFFLVKLFGDVPFYTEPFESSDADMQLPRTAKATIYTQIASDLNDAIAVLPNKTFADNKFRVTKNAAAMLLADVYFYQGDNANAATAIKTVLASDHALTAHKKEITAANYEETKLESAWNQLRTTDGLAETIYAYEYDGSISKASRWAPMAFDASILAWKDDCKYSICERIYGPVPYYLNVYEEGDMRALPNQFYHWEFTHPDKPELKWSRKVEDGPGAWYFYTYEDILKNGYSAKDRDLYRYAEALLLAAEAIAQSGTVAEAAPYLAKVQARAYMNETEATLTAKLAAMSKQAFVEECWKERLRELPFDFKIWDDIVRTKKFPVISKTTKGDVTFVDTFNGQTTNASGAIIKESDLLWPISPDELQRNPNLTQNPGY